MTELHFKVKNALLKMDFIRRYEELSGHFSSERTPSDERLVYVERDEVMSIIRDLGYSPMFHSKEKFYKNNRGAGRCFYIWLSYHIAGWHGRFGLGSQGKWRTAAWRTLGRLFKAAY